MVYLSRSVVAKPGKFLDLVKWGKEAVEYLNNKYGTKLNVYSQKYGGQPISTIFFIGEYENVAHIEEIRKKMMEDQGYLDMMPKFIELAVEGSTYDLILDKH